MENFKRQRIEPAKIPDQVRAKWPDTVLAEGYVPFPKTFLRSLGQLFPNSGEIQEIAALLAVVDFKRPNLIREPSLSFLAFIAGLGEEDFKMALKRLEAKGFLRISGSEDRMVISLTGLALAIEEKTKDGA